MRWVYLYLFFYISSYTLCRIRTYTPQNRFVAVLVLDMHWVIAASSLYRTMILAMGTTQRPLEPSPLDTSSPRPPFNPFVADVARSGVVHIPTDTLGLSVGGFMPAF